ncbi:pentapeptide repeat-containing protein [Azospirillum sp. A26]|uniref:pentapeptide repeat-containing protein n=1 Tax=Azospirillum sp. A26 TaxID=3160607 RepID=UPI00366ED053
MADIQDLERLAKGTKAWNAWRKVDPDRQPDLREAELRNLEAEGIDFSDTLLSGADLSGADLSEASLRTADLSQAKLPNAVLRAADLWKAKLKHADLSGANLGRANLTGAELLHATMVGTQLSRASLQGAIMTSANLTRACLHDSDLSFATLNEALLVEADLTRAKLEGAELTQAGLTRADLSQANLHQSSLKQAYLAEANLSQSRLTEAELKSTCLERTLLLETDLRGATIHDCKVYGISAWKPLLNGAKQARLQITPSDETKLTVDSIEVAQFIYLMLSSERISDIFNATDTKGVLLLGRFTEKRKEILENLRNALRNSYNLVPIVFDFDRPARSNLGETISRLSGLSRFIIADITQPRAVPAELQIIAPSHRIPIIPILQRGKPTYALFSNLLTHTWVGEVFLYDTAQDVGNALPELIRRAETIAEAIRRQPDRNGVPAGGPDDEDEPPRHEPGGG